MDHALPAELAAVRERLVSLAEAHGRGELDDETYETRRREAERALAQAVLAAPVPAADSTATQASPTRHRPSTPLIAALVAVIALIAVGGYAFTGSPSLAGLGAPPKPQATIDAKADPEDPNQREIGLQQIAEMVDKLAARLKDKPDDAEGWTMLARSYTVLTRYRDALPAYRHAIALQPKNAGLIADYSDALAAANGGKPDAESLAMIDRALAIDATQPKALALAGTVAFDRGDFSAAVTQWQKIADRLPPDSEFHQQVMANIDEARRRGNLPATTKPSGPSSSSPPVAAASTALPAGRETLTGTVRLAPALASRVAPTDTVFVLARPEGARMPLAVQRATVADLPLRFRLDDSMAMTPTAKLSTTPQVIVAARISKSGNAISQPGDLAGEIGPIVPGTSGLTIEIAKEVGPR